MRKSMPHLTPPAFPAIVLAIALGSPSFLGFAAEPTDFDRLTFHQAPKPLADGALTADWPRFLGPEDNCHSPESPLLEDFSSSAPMLVWSVDRGASHTSPVVAGDRLVMIHALDGREIIECLHAESGRRFWKVDYPVTLGQSYGIRDAPRCAPVIDLESGLVFSLGVKGKLLALQLEDGAQRWEKTLPAEFGDAPLFFGYGGSPLIVGDRLIVNTGSDRAGIVALEKTSGKEVWRAPSGWNGSYASPVAGEVNGKARIFALAAGMVDPPHGGLLCLDPESGNIDDRVEWRSRMFASVLAASPVPAGAGRVFITEDYGRGGAMIAFDEGFKASIDWQAPRFGAQFQTPMFHEGHLYGFTGSSDPGAELVCYDAASGEEKWREGFAKLNTNIGRTHLLHADGAFWCVGASGLLVKLDLSPAGAEVIDSVELFQAPETWALPALSRGLLYVAENGMSPKLRCYDLRGASR